MYIDNTKPKLTKLPDDLFVIPPKPPKPVKSKFDDLKINPTLNPFAVDTIASSSNATMKKQSTSSSESIAVTDSKLSVDIIKTGKTDYTSLYYSNHESTITINRTFHRNKSIC